MRLAISDAVDTAPKLYYTWMAARPALRCTVAQPDPEQEHPDPRPLGGCLKNSRTRVQLRHQHRHPSPVVAATPAAGSYDATQSVVLTVSDNKDAAPKLYYTTDGSLSQQQLVALYGWQGDQRGR